LGAESNLSVFENFDQEAVSYFKDVIKEWLEVHGS
jgi:hypothetical protein